MAPTSSDPSTTPWPQRVYDRIWLLALSAMAFFFLSYVAWGLTDLLTLPGGIHP